MNKRYQVFVSSTYADLKEERQHVLQALMEMDCIPAGMELFPAADEEQWEFIKKIIDDCDYYLLIIGGRYGSTIEDGISYTEKEFDYAVKKGLRVLALVHGSPDDIPFGKSEQDPSLRSKLISFKDKVMDGRLVKFWSQTTELPGLVALSLSKTIKMYPAVGWVRASNIASEDLLLELNDLRKQNSELQSTLASINLDQKPIVEGIADINSKMILNGTCRVFQGLDYGTINEEYSVSISWDKIFSMIAPYLESHPNESSVKSTLSTILHKISGCRGYPESIDDQDFKTIGIQLKAYGLIKIDYTKTTKGGMALFWSLTKKGEHFMIETRVVRETD